MDMWDSLLRTLSALAIVLVLMAGVAMVARRLLGHHPVQSGRHTVVRVVATGFIGPRKTISLVSVAGDYLIVGSTPTDLIPLGRVSDSAKVDALLNANATDSPSGDPSMASSALASWLQYVPEEARRRRQEHYGEL
ncbi:MAG: flagellar biosynthetic protein FliO [Nitrospira sp.]|nr:flagellar biosynthetic protein FliO [Nitrospira sp.]